MTISQRSFGWMLALAMAGCGDDSSSGGGGNGGGGSGGEATLTTCQGFCSLAIGCGFLADDGSCEGTCENDIDGARDYSAACGDRLEERYECLVDLSCQELDDWNSRLPPDSFPCRDEQRAAETACGN